ncbi:MAG: hypothetical protein KA731_00025 [Candidatus Moranbacteria bacterium]|nr:hypothetical protein [Candidatus Moranbacteria bacterium]MBP7695730.1 hypothetical protein [Candidatus Moranbacteria bacterium]
MAEKPSFLRMGGGHNFSGGQHPAPAAPIIPRPIRESELSAPRREEAGSTKRTSKSAQAFDVLISIALFALFFGIPIFFTGITFQGIVFEKQIYFYFWLLVGIVSWASKGVITGEMHIRRTPIDIFVLLFLAAYALSSFLSVDRWHSFWGFFGDPSRGLISVVALVLAYYLIMSHFTMKRFSIMFSGFLASGFIVVLWSFLALTKIKFLPDSLEQYAPLSLIGTVSTLGIFVTVLVPLFITALYFVWNQTAMKQSTKYTLFSLIGVGLIGVLYLMLALYPFLLDTKDSLAWMVPLGGIAFFLVYILAQIVRPPEQLTWVPMLVFVAVLAFLMIGTNSLVRATLPVEVSPNQRLSFQVAEETLSGDHFFLGVGPANYGYAFSMFRPNEYNDSLLYSLRFYQGTGVFFESLSTIGVIGTALLLVVWLSFLSVGLYLLSSEKEKNKYLSLGLWTTSVMMFIAAFTAPINGTLLMIGVLLSALALALLFKESGIEERYYSLSLKASPKYALALAFVFMLVSAGVAFLFVFIGKAYMADAAVGQASRLSVSGPQKESVTLLLSALQKNPEEGRYYTRLGQELLGLANVEARKPEKDRNAVELEQTLRDAVALTTQGKNRMPNDVLAVESLALVYENGSLYASDALEKAYEYYARASELEPTNPILLVKQGQVKRSLADQKKDGDIDKDQLYRDSEMYLKTAVEKKADLPAALYNLSVTQSRLKDTEGAIKSVTDALRYDRSNVNFKFNLGVLYQIRDKDGDKEKAETLFRDVLKTNEKLIDVRLSLGLLYETWSKRDQALEEYRKILEYLPADGADNVQSTREQVEKFIENLRSGKGNIAKNNADEVVQPTDIAPAPALEAPANPNVSPIANPAP